MEDNKNNKQSRNKNWSRDATTALILLYEQHPCLYAIKSADYHNKNKRAAALKEITGSLSNDYGKNVTTEEVLKKIHGLRTQFLAELNKIEKTEHSGAGCESLYKPKLWCFDLLTFLQDSNPVVTTGVSNLNEDSSEINEYGDESEEICIDFEDSETLISESPSPSTSSTDRQTPDAVEVIKKPSKSSKKRKYDMGLSQIVSKAVNALDEINKSEKSINNESMESIFGEMVAAELRSINDEEIVDDAKLKIMEILLNAKKECRKRKVYQNSV